MQSLVRYTPSTRVSTKLLVPLHAACAVLSWTTWVHRKKQYPCDAICSPSEFDTVIPILQAHLPGRYLDFPAFFETIIRVAFVRHERGATLADRLRAALKTATWKPCLSSIQPAGWDALWMSPPLQAVIAIHEPVLTKIFRCALMHAPALPPVSHRVQSCWLVLQYVTIATQMGHA